MQVRFTYRQFRGREISRHRAASSPFMPSPSAGRAGKGCDLRQNYPAIAQPSTTRLISLPRALQPRVSGRFAAFGRIFGNPFGFRWANATGSPQ